MNMEFLTRVTRQTEMKGRMMNGKNIYRKIFNDIRFEMSLCLSTKFYFPINISFILRTMNTSFCKVIKYRKYLKVNYLATMKDIYIHI